MPEAWHVGRTMRLLELLAFAPLSAPQLAAALHAHPRTVRRVLAQLEEDGYVTHRDPRRRVYAPTMRLVALAGQIVDHSALAARARPYVALLHERTGATAHLVVPSYDKALCLVHAAGDDAPPRLRELVPAHATAGGKALLAHRDRWRASILGAPLARCTDRTATDPQALRRALDAVAADGVAIEDGEYRDGVRAVAAPVFDGDTATAAAALCVSGRGLDVQAAAPPVRAAARELSAALTEGGA